MPSVKLSESELSNLKDEVIMAQRLNEEHLEGQIQEAIQRYTGEHIPLIGQNWDIVLNEIYPIIQFNMPSIFFRNPRAFLKPRTKTFIVKRRDPVTGKMVETFADASKSAKTQENILNYIVKEIRYKKEVQKVLFDALLFKFGVLWHGYKGEFGITDERSIFIKKESIFVKRLSPMRFLKDPAVGISDIDEARWVGRSFDIPLDDLVEDDNLNIEKSLKGRAGFGDKIQDGRFSQRSVGGLDILRPKNKRLIDFTSGTFKESSRSRFVEVFEIFVRPSLKEKKRGEKGKVVLFTNEQKKALRVNAWPYKAEGWPTEILEFNPLNDSQFGLADIETYKSIADQKNAIVNLQLRNAQENSKVWVAIAKEGIAGEEDIEMIRKGDQTVILFNDSTINGKMSLASPGGTASSELYLIDQRIQKNLEDKSGVTDLKRGFLQSGEESAASVKIRAAGSSVRPAYRQDIMSDFLVASMGKINQYNKQFFTIDEAVRIVGSLDVEWSENPSKEEIQADVDVELDVISMLPENPEDEIQKLQTVLGLLVQGVSDPTIRQKLSQEGMTVELKPIIENLLMRLRIRDPQIFRRIKPEESQGFVSVAEMRAARANTSAILSGQPEIPSPPEPGQDHMGRMEVFMSILSLIQELGQTEASMRLEQLIQIHQQLLEEEQKKDSPQPGQSVRNLKKPSFADVGSTNGVTSI